ncbi:MAG: LysM peptidoglycan-binding domain-containing protein [Clostridia bacterium]|nr:LysM peptidoglycan-binding domain-containing protein [Clostridia bacterium]
MAKKKYEEPVVNTNSEAGPAEEPALRVHIVRKGDTLRNIARDYLGDSRRVQEIRNINQLATDILKVGRELIIPDR